jgi:serine/threonine protein kinase
MQELPVGNLYLVREPIDRPQGHFARVYLADDLRERTLVAFKVLRAEHLSLDEKAKRKKYRAFATEAKLLSELAGVPHVMRLKGCGYLQEDRSGETAPIPCSVEEFIVRMPEAMAKNWRPFLTLGLMNAKDSLFRTLDQRNGGRRLPTEEALRMSIQLAELYAEIHARGIVYWDAKPEHAYWQRESRNVVLIDWNVSDHFSPQEAATKVAEDILLLGQCILYPAFVGLDFVTGQTPLARPTGTVGGVRARLVFDRSVNFYSQEEWLDQPVKRVLQRVVSRNGYERAADLLDDLHTCAHELGWDVPGRTRSGLDPQALSHQDVVQALSLLDEAQQSLQKARELLEQAALRIPLHDREIQRLISESTDFWKKRVIP